MEEIRMQPMLPICEAKPTTARIVEVEERKEINQAYKV
jgi:hypothetical protein